MVGLIRNGTPANLVVLSARWQLSVRQKLTCIDKCDVANLGAKFLKQPADPGQTALPFRTRHRRRVRPGRVKLTQQLSFSVSIDVLAPVS